MPGLGRARDEAFALFVAGTGSGAGVVGRLLRWSMGSVTAFGSAAEFVLVIFVVFQWHSNCPR